METLNRPRIRSFSDLTILRLSLRDLHSGSERSQEQPATSTPSLLRWFLSVRLDCGLCERPCYLLDRVALDHIANLDVVEVGNADAALEALANFFDVVLEALQ